MLSGSLGAFLFLSSDRRTKATCKRQGLFGTYSFTELESMDIMAETMVESRKAWHWNTS